MADAGIGIAETLLLMEPSVSRGRRTEKRCASCAMVCKSDFVLDYCSVYVRYSVAVFEIACAGEGNIPWWWSKKDARQIASKQTDKRLPSANRERTVKACVRGTVGQSSAELTPAEHHEPRSRFSTSHLQLCRQLLAFLILCLLL